MGNSRIGDDGTPLAAVEDRLASIEILVQSRYDAMDQRFDALEGGLARVVGRLDAMDQRIDTVVGGIAQVVGRLDQIDNTLGKL